MVSHVESELSIAHKALPWWTVVFLKIHHNVPRDTHHLIRKSAKQQQNQSHYVMNSLVLIYAVDFW